MRRLPPMTSLAAFDAVARTGSVTAASFELGRTHGAVSRQIKNLQDDTGLSLFEKQGNGIRLTEQGRDLHGIVRKALDLLEYEIGVMRRQANDRAFHLGISPTLALKWLMPRLPRFSALFPDIEIRLYMAGREQLTYADCDIILTFDRLSWDPRGQADFHVIGDVAFGLVMAPSASFERTDTGCKVSARLSREDQIHSWQAWEALSGILVDAEKSLQFPQTALALEAAAAGQGVALAEMKLVSDDIERGRLIAPFGFNSIADGFGALVSPMGSKTRVVRRFLAWLKDEAAQTLG